MDKIIGNYWQLSSVETPKVLRATISSSSFADKGTKKATPAFLLALQKIVLLIQST
ncbi:MAG: hypothetical protein IJP75_03350 [Bacteroidaceae bacterium]|nr:hypothetical protein [Bacteroidaceae bacterium]